MVSYCVPCIYALPKERANEQLSWTGLLLINTHFCYFRFVLFYLQKFRFCGDLDCPDWILAEISILSKLVGSQLKLHVTIGSSACRVILELPQFAVIEPGNKTIV